MSVLTKRCNAASTPTIHRLVVVIQTQTHSMMYPDDRNNNEQETDNAEKDRLNGDKGHKYSLSINTKTASSQIDSYTGGGIGL